MKFGICTLDDFDVASKTVLCRVDINEPIDQKTDGLKDTARILSCIPTIKELSERKAKVVLLAHQGSDLEYRNYYTTQPHAKVISKYLEKDISFIDDISGPCAREKIKSLKDGEILLLDNVRFAAEEMTLFETKLRLNEVQQSKTQIVKKLAPLADLYVCDAFAAAHRSQPTLVGFQQILPSAMGRLFEKEMSALNEVMNNPRNPCVFILGGEKIQDSFIMMSSVLKCGAADKIITGGLISQVMFIAKGIDIGRESTEFIYKSSLSEYIDIAKVILEEYEDRILLPVDLSYIEDGRVEVDVKNLPANVGSLIVDIGYKSVEIYRNVIKTANTLFINGPMGVFENDASEYGTKSVWELVSSSKAFSLLGGGHSIAAVNKYGLENEISYICTAGGALVRFLSGEELPVVKALRYAAKKMEISA